VSPLLRVRKLLGRIRRRFQVDVFDVFARPVPVENEGADAPAAASDYTLRWGTIADVARCDPFHTELDERERRLGARRLELGHRVVIAFADDDQPVFSMWVNPRNLNIPGLVKRRLAPDQWFIYKAYTSPEHRSRKLYQAGMRFVLAEMSKEGLRELVGYAHVKKEVSRKGLARLSFGAIGRMRHVNVPGWARTFLSDELVRRFPEDVARTGVLEGDAT